MEGFGYEIDFLPVGTGERNGDAIAARFGMDGNYKVLVYDGGTKVAGEALVDHIQTHYKTDRVDYLVNSHPDQDHASGLSVVLENLEVGELWMHQPWEYSDTICDYFKDGRITSTSLADRLKNKMAAAYALEEAAKSQEIPIYEPFQGSAIGPFQVCSPDREWYVHTLISDFEKSPEAAKAVFGGGVGTLIRAAEKALTWVSELWGVELLRENVTTSAENESSVVLYANFGGKGVLLTGDAGIQALAKAADWAEGNFIDFPSVLRFVQVPHHGGRHNVSPSVLNRIIGPKLGQDATATKTAFVSVSSGCSTHPRKMVVNGFLRRGARTYKTCGNTIWHHSNMPSRNWGPITPLPFSSTVEDWE